MAKLKHLINTPFENLNSWASKALHIGITISLCIFLIYGLNAFNFSAWLKVPEWLSFLGLLSFILIGLGVMIALQLGIYIVFKKRVFKLKHLFMWLLTELTLISLILALLYGNINNPWNEWITTLKYTSFILVLPYTFSLVIISSVGTTKKIASPTASEFSSHLLHFTDEKEQTRLSIKSSKVLYLESSDNYVTIYYNDEKGVRKELVRNTLKRIETQMADKGLIRCHRSYIINVSNIETIKKVNRSYQIKLKDIESFIPVSNSFVPQIRQITGR